MSKEEALKEYILSNYKSIRSFANSAGINYQTIMSIFSRGLDKSNISNIIKICQALNISTDELAEGRIVRIDEAKKEPAALQLENVIQYAATRLNASKNITLDGRTISEDDLELLLNCIDIGIELIRRKRN